ncbi:hypothetical protein XENTR_v10024353 [Xenopus tropicalis]|nr:hypothetical protein XENTR_v10024353 [Xenopus tropicalis]
MDFESCLDNILISARCKGGISCSSPILSVCSECYKGTNSIFGTVNQKTGQKPVGNLMMSTILLSGSNCYQVSHMKILGLKQVSKSTHYQNQHTYLLHKLIITGKESKVTLCTKLKTNQYS